MHVRGVCELLVTSCCFEPQDCAACVALLLQAGADPNAATNAGDVPLHAACHAGNLSVLQMLLEAGAVVDVRNHRLDTPLHYACRAGHTDVVAALLEAVPDVNVRGAHGATPLLLAMVHHRYETVKVLLMAGADHRLADEEGMRPFQDTSLEEVLRWLQLPSLDELPAVKEKWLEYASRGTATSSPTQRRQRASRGDRRGAPGQDARRSGGTSGQARSEPTQSPNRAAGDAGRPQPATRPRLAGFGAASNVLRQLRKQQGQYGVPK